MKKFGKTYLLVGIVLLSGLIYWLVFTRPAGFLTLAGRSKVYQDYLYESPPGVRWLLIASLLALAGVLLLVLLPYWPLWQGPQVPSFTRRLDLFTTSLPAVIYQLSIPRLGEARAASLISDIALILTFAFVLWQGWRASCNPSPDFGIGEQNPLP